MSIFKNLIRSNRILTSTLRTGQVNCHSAKSGLSENDVEEIQIPVPWGHIAGKWWGRKDDTPILGIHGWQENAGTFDRLIPLLNISNFLAIDLPGHGLSSHFPVGKLYTYPEYLLAVRRIVKYFNWEKYSIFGHSYGSSLGFAYSSLYADEIEYFVSFECARSLLLAYAVNFPHHFAQGIDKILENETKKRDSSSMFYTLPEIIQSCITGSLGSINSSDSALILLKRGATQHKASEFSAGKKNKKSDLKVFLDHELSTNDELRKLNTYEKLLNDAKNIKSGDIKDSEYVYKFTKDQRVKVNQFEVLNDEVILELSKYITCPMLSIQAEDGFLNFESKHIYEKSNNIIKTKSKHFEHHFVQGNHHAHLNTPEFVAPVVNQFLKNLTS